MAWAQRDTERARALRNAATPAERTLWRHLQNRGLDDYKFSRQMPLGPYFCDFLCREAKLVVEIDGYSHDVSIEEDRRRDQMMQAQGYVVLGFSNADVLSNVEGVLIAIAEALKHKPTPDPSREREGG